MVKLYVDCTASKMGKPTRVYTSPPITPPPKKKHVEIRTLCPGVKRNQLGCSLSVAKNLFLAAHKGDPKAFAAYLAHLQKCKTCRAYKNQKHDKLRRRLLRTAGMTKDFQADREHLDTRNQFRYASWDLHQLDMKNPPTAEEQKKLATALLEKDQEVFRITKIASTHINSWLPEIDFLRRYNLTKSRLQELEVFRSSKRPLISSEFPQLVDMRVVLATVEKKQYRLNPFYLKLYMKKQEAAGLEALTEFARVNNVSIIY